MASNLPPGVTGSEPELTGEWPCLECGMVLPEQAECSECGAQLVPRERENHTGASWTCEGCGHVTGDAGICPTGCRDLD